MIGSIHCYSSSIEGHGDKTMVRIMAGRWRVARDITEAEENDANKYAPAAILQCDRCGTRQVVEGSNKHPLAQAARVPDQSVFK